MSIPFSNTTDNNGIAEQARYKARVDSTQWANYKIANSANDWHDFITGYAIGNDKRFQWDDTNHTKLPEGTTNLVANQSDYSFLTDEQGNSIITLTRIDMLANDGVTWVKLKEIDQADVSKEIGLRSLFATTAQPLYYDKIADNIIRLYPTPNTSITNGLRFYFQRTGSYFTASDTTKSPGVSPLLHKGYVIACAYDIAITLGLDCIATLKDQLNEEKQKVIQYFADRNQDIKKVMIPKRFNFR